LRVKICGLTRYQDARDAALLGADALGFNFWPQSPRAVSVTRAASIIKRLPPFVSTVAVLVNPSLELVRQVLASCRIDYLQFHGEESPEFVAQFPGDKVIKALGIQDSKSLAALKKYPAVGAWLLDSAAGAARGGTGKVFRWDLAIKAKRRGRPVILAGGLTPDNVAEAVRSVKPWGVDTASGVESGKKGIKDKAKMRKFILSAKHA
jgi:phosphoribosylanthranilate isomerase